MLVAQRSPMTNTQAMQQGCRMQRISEYLAMV